MVEILSFTLTLKTFALDSSFFIISITNEIIVIYILVVCVRMSMIDSLLEYKKILHNFI